jgi:hypothetical protein
MRQLPVSMVSQPWAPATQGELTVLFLLVALVWAGVVWAGATTLPACLQAKYDIGYGANNMCMAQPPSLPCRFDNCDGNPSNGCETNLNTDVANCGACNTAATPVSNAAAPACVNGQPGLGTCNTG